ncbi:unnamed protein product [Brassica napus]|uniref:(rape) hypothetical protein n=1 Tax=Brassica napus TaxID=3708 RepID=A0A816ZAK7_BRANA|nr:unnamed protein product [Brassica napus]
MDLTVINHLEVEEDERGNENDDTTAHKNLVVNEKCDVYGFGVLILELLTGRRLMEYGEDSFVILSDHVRVLLEQGNVLECIDPIMEEEYSEDEVLPFLKLSLLILLRFLQICLQWQRLFRSCRPSVLLFLTVTGCSIVFQKALC